MVQLVDLARCV
ncbi:TPA: hypothetical protein K9R44_000401 [Escherichia coli]|nr:hypothetical protein [Escherichia coli]